MKKIAYVLFLFAISSCATSGMIDSTWNEYENKEFGFRFKYPKEWEKGPGTGAQTIYVSYEKEPREYEGSLSFSITSNFYVDVEDRLNISLEEIGNNYEFKVANNENLKNGKIHSRKKIEFKNFDAIEFIGSADMMGMTAKWKIVVFQTEKNYYELCSTTALEKFDSMIPTIDSIFDSFEFTKN